MVMFRTSDFKWALCSLLLLNVGLEDRPAHRCRQSSVTGLPRGHLCIIYWLCKEKVCLAQAVLTVQTGYDLGFNLRSSLKSALSSTPSPNPRKSISRRQLIIPGPILEAAAIWGSIQGVLTDRQSQLGSDDCRGVSMLHANLLSCQQFSTCWHLVRLRRSFSKESWHQVGGRGLAFLFTIPPMLLWLSEGELGFLKSHHFYQMGKGHEPGRDRFL